MPFFFNIIQYNIVDIDMGKVEVLMLKLWSSVYEVSSIINLAKDTTLSIYQFGVAKGGGNGRSIGGWGWKEQWNDKNISTNEKNDR